MLFHASDSPAQRVSWSSSTITRLELQAVSHFVGRFYDRRRMQGAISQGWPTLPILGNLASRMAASTAMSSITESVKKVSGYHITHRGVSRFHKYSVSGIRILPILSYEGIMIFQTQKIHLSCC